MQRLTLLIILLNAGLSLAQQKLSGYITDELDDPIPFAKIFVKNSAGDRTMADVNGYYEMWLLPDEYFLVYSASGYQDRESYVTLNETSVQKNMTLFPAQIKDIDDVNVETKRTNPGREIMLKVVEKRDQINPWNRPHTVHAYIKATEKIDRKEDKKDRKKRKSEETNNPSGIEDPFAEKRDLDAEFVNNMNLIEVDLTRHFSPRDNVKEIRNAYEERSAEEHRLYYTTTVKSNFNFFQNLLRLEDLNEIPISSPISTPGILSYKYRLVEQYEENGQKIHKIKIIPRSTATTTLSGHIYVIDSLWLVQKLTLTMEKGNLLEYDYFRVSQQFDHPGDSLCILTKQTLEYGVKYKDESSTCTTIATFDHYNFQVRFDKKFFNKEIAVTEQEAYDKDSSFWAESRKISLTQEERQYIIKKDSIYEYTHRTAYLDSVDSLFNKVTFLKVLWWGVDHRNRSKRIQWTINSIAASARPVYIAGPRIEPGFYFFKKWEKERFIDGYGDVSYGFLNKDIKGSTGWDIRYAPFHFGTFNADFHHNFDVIRGYDAISQIYKRDNFIEITSLQLGNSYEVLNGLYWDADFSFTERRSLADYEFIEVADSILPNNDPTEFENYQALLFQSFIRYTPGQRYMREPNRKVVLGSKWPTLYVWYEKGIPNLFGSDVNHDYIRFGVMQTFKIGLLGTSNYHITSGWFFNTKRLFDADQKFHRRSDPLWFSNPLYSFQGLQTNLPTQKVYFEGHFVHHDNGALINKIPFMKKTGIGMALGAGALYIPEFNWQHYEVFAGLERNFKFSKRRLRVGVYGILSDGNQMVITPDWKISFAILDNRNLKWNF